MATVVQFAESVNRESYSATFASPVTAGNVMLCAIVGMGTTPSLDPGLQVGGYNPSGWIQLGPLQGDATSEVGTLAARIYGKTAVGGETQVHRRHDSSDQTMTILEVSGITLASIVDSAQLDNDNQGNPATFDLGTLAGDGWAIQLTTWGRDHGAATDFSTTPGTGWTEITDRGDGTAILTSGHYHVQVRDVTTSADPSISVTESGGAGIGTGGGVAFLFGTTTAVSCSFTATPTSGGTPLEVQFTDTSSGDPDTWLWDFGDSGSSTDQNPTHTYTAVGTYDVTLTATRSSDDDECSLAVTAFIVASGPGVFIDWANDGFEAGTDDEVSGDPQNVISWIINRGASAELTGGSTPGSATLTLKNPSDIYNPRNASSPLTGLLRDGAPVWIGVNSDGKLTGSAPRGLFGGRITDITLIPAGGATESPTVEIACEDMLGWAQRTPVQLDYEEGRAHDALREAALQAAGEGRYDLAHEIHTMPLSHADTDLARVLDDLNEVTGTRHFAKPANAYTDWFSYTTRNRFWRTSAESDASLDAASDHVTGTSGWRLSADTVINRQKATVTPIAFTPAAFVVWQAESLPFNVTEDRPFSRIVDFDDVVRDAVLDIASTGDTVTATLTPFASAAKIELSVAAGDEATITQLQVEGRLARRLVSESVTSDDTTSQAAPRGIREKGEIGNEYLGVIASARGIAAHVVVRFGNPQLRPTMTVENWFPEQFELDLYDVISFTSTQLDMTSRLFEIVGLTHEGRVAADTVQHHVTTYVLQECRWQTDPGWFVLDSSLLDGSDSLHY